MIRNARQGEQGICKRELMSLGLESGHERFENWSGCGFDVSALRSCTAFQSQARHRRNDAAVQEATRSPLQDSTSSRCLDCSRSLPEIMGVFAARQGCMHFKLLWRKEKGKLKESAHGQALTLVVAKLNSSDGACQKRQPLHHRGLGTLNRASVQNAT